VGILPHSYVKAKGHRLFLMTALAAALYLGSGLALSWIAGFQSVWNEAQHPQWAWLAASLGFVALAFVGYYFGYRGVGRVEGGPDNLGFVNRLAVVAAGFGGFLAQEEPGSTAP
jgi:membrane protein implicated in regulation of membrane protease activity